MIQEFSKLKIDRTDMTHTSNINITEYPLKVLTADDNLFSRRLLKTILQRAGYEVIEAADGPETWSIIQNEDAPKLIILDWMMPGMDGLEICRRIRETETNCTNPSYIIMVTSKTNMEDVVRGLRAGINDYITKPFDNEELKARISIGARIVKLQMTLDARLRQLEEAMNTIKTLDGLLSHLLHMQKDPRRYWILAAG